jgi:hypothetical protein
MRWLVGLPAAVLVLSSCSAQTYNVVYKNVSTEKITETRGLWGKYFLNSGGNFDPYNGYPKQSGFTNGSLQYPIPAEAGARWKNAEGEKINVLVPLDKRQFPRINKHENYEFVFELRQTDIRQVELVVHGQTRSKKRKVMLYCAATEVKGCQFNTPFNTDTFYDSPEQEAEVKSMKAAAAKAKYGDKNKQSERDK